MLEQQFTKTWLEFWLAPLVVSAGGYTPNEQNELTKCKEIKYSPIFLP